MGILHIGLVFAVVFIIGVVSQVDLNNSYTIDKMPIRDKVLFLADFLINHPNMFARLEKVFHALSSSGVAGSILGGGGDAETGLFNFVLDSLPTLVSNPLLPGVLAVVKSEIDDVNVTDIGLEISGGNLKPGDKKYDQVFADKFLPRINVLRLFHRILSLSSFKSFLPLKQNSTLTGKCYNNTMLYLDSLKGGESSHGGDGQGFGQDWTIMTWANKMLFSSGLIGDDRLKMDALIKSCQSVNVLVSAGTVLAGNTSVKHNVTFQTQFCNVTFSVPSGVREMFGMISGKRGNTISWGVCAPETCSDDDIIDIFKLGKLQRFLHVKSVHCGIKSANHKVCGGIGSPGADAKNVASPWLQNVLVAYLVLTLLAVYTTYLY